MLDKIAVRKENSVSLRIVQHAVKLRVLILFLFISSLCFSQREANIWYFGTNAGLDFNSGAPVALLNGALDTFEGCATISDSNGNLLFYSDGSTVYNRDHQIMLNGTGLNGNVSSTHSAIIVPKPGDPNIYYIFTVPATGNPIGLQYSEVDMTLDGGLGAINSVKNVFLDRTSEKITAVRSSVANEYWVVSHRWIEDQGTVDPELTDEFIAFNVSSAGINPTPVVSAVGTPVGGDFRSAIGQIKISPDGTKLAVARYIGLSEFQLFDFNSATGEISNAITLARNFDINEGTSGQTGPYGIEFSPNSQRLYCGVFDGHLFQFDLSSGNAVDIIASQTQLSADTDFRGSLQVATDGKIYMAKAAVFMDVIDLPNEVGLLSNYTLDAVDLAGRNGGIGLPPFIQTFFQTSIQVQNVCFGDVTEFSINDSVDTAN
jgi:hypothetical protein